jgi:hypothetical protein
LKFSVLISEKNFRILLDKMRIMAEQGVLLKMHGEIVKEVSYYLTLGPDIIHMNKLLGRTIGFEYQGIIHCIRCGRITKKSFAQGFCYPCFTTAPETSECVLRPELCRAHEGISRDMKWSEDHCLQDHFVYLAISSGLKVGVTRSSQIPTRWIDQGAWKAIKLATTPNRFIAGQIEVALKARMSDKTNWRHMLTNEIDRGIDLILEKKTISDYLPDDLSSFLSPDNEITEINYPVLQYPEKVRSVSFDKHDTIGGELMGIKGQYLIFSDGSVLNIRKHNGYLVNLET